MEKNLIKSSFSSIRLPSLPALSTSKTFLWVTSKEKSTNSKTSSKPQKSTNKSPPNTNGTSIKLTPFTSSKSTFTLQVKKALLLCGTSDKIRKTSFPESAQKSSISSHLKESSFVYLKTTRLSLLTSTTTRLSSVTKLSSIPLDLSQKMSRKTCLKLKISVCSLHRKPTVETCLSHLLYQALYSWLT